MFELSAIAQLCQSLGLPTAFALVLLAAMLKVLFKQTTLLGDIRDSHTQQTVHLASMSSELRNVTDKLSEHGEALHIIQVAGCRNYIPIVSGNGKEH